MIDFVCLLMQCAGRGSSRCALRLTTSPLAKKGPLSAAWTRLIKKTLPKIFIVLYCGCFCVLDSMHNVFVTAVKRPKQMES